MTDVWLRCVHGFGAVADVLGGVEHTEGETSKKITWRKKPYIKAYNHEKLVLMVIRAKIVTLALL